MPDDVQGMAVLSSCSGAALRRANAFVADACRGLSPQLTSAETQRAAGDTVPKDRRHCPPPLRPQLYSLLRNPARRSLSRRHPESLPNDVSMTSSRVGTPAWAGRTGGILSRRERISLLGDAIRLQMRILPAQPRALLGRPDSRAFSVDPDRLRIPDTMIAREAEALSSE